MLYLPKDSRLSIGLGSRGEGVDVSCDSQLSHVITFLDSPSLEQLHGLSATYW
jgi:hypothetical protein